MKEKDDELTCERLLELGDDARINLGQFAAILKNYSGCTSPAEEFITALVRYHALGISLTPKNIEDDLEAFRDNFEATVESTRHFVNQYPAEVLGDNCGGWIDQFRRLKTTAMELDDPGWSDRALSRLEIAREAIRQYPALVLSDDSWEEIKKRARALS